MLQSTPLKEISSSKFKTPSFYNRVSCLCLHPILCFVYIPVNSISPLGIKISSLKGYWLRVILTFSRVAVLRTLIQLYYHFTSSIPDGISSSLNWFRGSVSGLVLVLSSPFSLNRIVVLLSGH
jgi:hypothetical protein